MKTTLISTVAALALFGSANAFSEPPKVLFVLDGSGSMWSQIEGRHKIEIARTVMGDLLTNLPEQTRAGLMSFGHNRKDDCEDIELVAPVGSDPQALVAALNRVNPMGRTPLTDAIRQAALSLRDHEGTASVVLVSDGEETCGGDPCQAARVARESGVGLRIHVVGFDVTAQETKQLTCIAEAGGGRYFQAADAQELTLALAEVRREVVEAPPPPPPPVPAPVQVAQAQPTASGVLFEDRFDREELGEMWEVINHDPNRLAVSGGTLFSVTTTRPADHVSPTNFALLQKTFQGDFVATVKMKAPVTLGVFAGLYYWADDQNYVMVGPLGNRLDHYPQSQNEGNLAGYTPEPRVRINSSDIGGSYEKYLQTYYPAWRPLLFVGTVGNTSSTSFLRELGGQELKGESPAPEVWHLQLERNGLRLTGRISLDGQQWTDIGSQVIVNRNGRLGIGAYQDWENGFEQPIEFEYFVVNGGI